MHITKYTTQIAAMLGCKAKPEPWLRIALDCSPEQYGETGKQDWQVSYVIYVWDTRQVIDDDTVHVQATTKQIDKLRNMPSPPDNFEPLVGKFKNRLAVSTFNDSFYRLRQKRSQAANESKSDADDAETKAYSATIYLRQVFKTFGDDQGFRICNKFLDMHKLTKKQLHRIYEATKSDMKFDEWLEANELT